MAGSSSGLWVGVASLLTTTATWAIPLACYQDPRTDAVQCIDDKSVVEKDGIRSAALWTGGPKNIEKTSYTVHVNCGTNVIHLKDRQGVSFAGGSGSETPASRSLRDMICGATPISVKKKK